MTENRQAGDTDGSSCKTAYVLGREMELLQADKCAPDLLIESVAFCGRSDPASVAIEELEASGAFEICEQAADCRLRNAQNFSGAGGGAASHNGFERFDLAKVHGKFQI